MQIGHMRFACIERDDCAFMLQIDFYVVHPGNVLQHRSQFAHALIAIFPSVAISIVSKWVIRAFRKNGSAGSVGRAGSMAT